MEQEEFLAIGKVAKRLGVRPETIRRWQKAGKIQELRSVLHDVEAIAALSQYVLFWALLTYALVLVTRHPFWVTLGGIATQVAELFWIAGQAPFWETMMPTFVSRLTAGHGVA
ncbi:MAG: MerR family transcriptional regulator [Firmicutes bacterium]|nr:MerR family transcriptional regulator [Bacillota bacterium]